LIITGGLLSSAMWLYQCVFSLATHVRLQLEAFGPATGPHTV
jgi:hypothetical protein